MRGLSLQVAAAAPGRPASAAVAAPAAVAATAPKGSGKQDSDVIAPIPQHDVVVDTIVESNPQTPRELLKAATLLADLGHADLAKPYLQKLIAAKLDESALADLAGQIDPAALVRMAANAGLMPEGQQVADAVLAAASRRARNPERLREAIAKLNDPSAAERRKAIVAILAVHENAVPILVEALAGPQQAGVHAAVQEVLVKLGAEAVPGLNAVLESRNVALEAQVIEVLSQIGAAERAPFDFTCGGHEQSA